MFLDVETDENQDFKLGVILRGNQKKPYVFHKKEDMENFIILEAIKEHAKKKRIKVYAHFSYFDYTKIFNLKSRLFNFCSMNPLFWTYNDDKGNPMIYLLDFYSIMKMPLWKVGELVGIKKKEIDFNGCNDVDLLEYCINDCEIIREGYLYIRKLLKDNGVNVRNIYSISQIAIKYLLTGIKDSRKLFEKKKQFVKLKYNDIYHIAYRSGYVYLKEAKKFDDVTAVDCNSLYPYCLMNLKVPSLHTEKRIYDPESKGIKFDHVKNKVGVANVLLINNHTGFPVLPVRSNKRGFLPGKGSSILGWWTIQEVKYAISIGYELVKMYNVIVFEDTYNPFLKVVKDTYSKKQSTEGFESNFYKMMMNSAIGKMGQRRERSIRKFVHYRYIDSYILENYKIISSEDEYYFVMKKIGHGIEKSYYCPVIPMLVNADARIKMHKEISKYGDNFIYTDTDSIFFIGKCKTYIDGGMGDFKLIFKNKDVDFYGLKNYLVGSRIIMSGIRKGMRNGKLVQYSRVKSLVDSDRGKFVKSTRDIDKMRDNYKSNVVTEFIADDGIDGDVLQDAVLQLNNIFK